MSVPQDPKIFHITHVDNLAGILSHGGILCDRLRRGGACSAVDIGHMHIKDRRMRRQVPVAAGGVLGDYVPFYFCSRSVMLYVVSRGHQDYGGGDGSIVHIVSSVQTANAHGCVWAFTDRHAELAHAAFFDAFADLDEVNWGVMPLRQWSQVKEERQAEFLVHERFPWPAVTHLVVKTDRLAAKVRSILAGQPHAPGIDVRSDWYY